MGVRSSNDDGISVHAIPGTRSVLFGFDASEPARQGLLGFALGKQRAGGQVAWMRGFKFFAETVPDPHPGERRSTLEHPIQSFEWGDYSAEPASTITYVIRPVYGAPKDLRYGRDVEITVQTAGEEGAKHAIYFNRGAIPSQAFADRFGNEGPSDAEQNDPANEKVKWLSRGLLEAALSFIGQANGPRFALHVAAYEFYYSPVLNALRWAAEAGARVEISFDGGDQKRDGSITPDDISKANLTAIAAAGLDAAPNLTLHPRTLYSKIPHNKFIVLLQEGAPRAVWTGSTNFTASGFLGQSNVGHIVRDEAVAAAYEAYWQALANDPETRPFKRAVTEMSPTPPDGPPPEGTTAIFSPRQAGMLEWYAGRLGAADSSVMFTAAFGVATELAEKFGEDRDFLRLLIMERPDPNPQEQALIERDRDTRVAFGAKLNKETIELELDGFRLDMWLREEEHFRTKGHIFYVHTKYMLLDALSDDPEIFTGSANFSEPSVTGNDENMLHIRGPHALAVADVYVTEFMRLFKHFYFRTVAVERAREARQGRTSPAAAAAARPGAMLDPADGCVASNFTPGRYHERLRLLFR